MNTIDGNLNNKEEEKVSKEGEKQREEVSKQGRKERSIDMKIEKKKGRKER